MALGRSWRNRVLWLVMGLPIVTLVASAVMVHLALRDAADSSSGQTRRIAQIQLEDLAPDREAARRGVRARLDANPSNGDIRVVFDQDLEGAPILELTLLHPSRASRDRRVPLMRDGSTWRGRTAGWPESQKWTLRLAGEAGSARAWRIAGRWVPLSEGAILGPAVAP